MAVLVMNLTMLNLCFKCLLAGSQDSVNRLLARHTAKKNRSWGRDCEIVLELFHKPRGLTSMKRMAVQLYSVTIPW